MKKEERNIVCTKCGQQVGEGYQSHKCPDIERGKPEPTRESLLLYTQEELDTYLKQSLEELLAKMEGKHCDEHMLIVEDKLKELK